METATETENLMLVSMISCCKCPPEGPELLPKPNLGGYEKISTAAVAGSGMFERAEVLHLVVVRVQRRVARVSLSSHEGSSPPRVVPSMVFINLAMLVTLWVYGLCHGHYVDDLVG